MNLSSVTDSFPNILALSILYWIIILIFDLYIEVHLNSFLYHIFTNGEIFNLCLELNKFIIKYLIICIFIFQIIVMSSMFFVSIVRVHGLRRLYKSRNNEKDYFNCIKCNIHF